MTLTMTKKKTTSWGVVILMLILFWPVGLFFLYKKVTADKEAAFKNSKTLTIIGWVLFGMGIIYCFSFLTGGMVPSEGDTTASSIMISLVFFCGGGLAIINSGKKMKLNAVKYKKYINIVVNQNSADIDNIAAAIPTSYENAMTDLQKMINIGYFEDAYIDINNRQLVMPQRQSTYIPPVESSTHTVASTTPVTKVVRCKNCGANNTITLGEVNECEYCGSPLLA